jgi:hypothetical protein
MQRAFAQEHTETRREVAGEEENSKIVLPLCGRKFRHVNVGIMTTTFQFIQGFKKKQRDFSAECSFSSWF